MNKTGKSLILIDESNLFYAFKKLNWELDYQKFHYWLTNNFNILNVYFFGGIISKKTFFDRNPGHTLGGFIQCKKERENFFSLLKKIGYQVRNKPVASLYDSTKGEYKRKCNFDVEITILALDQLSAYEELVLCSGDGDFTKLLKYVKGKYKKTTIIVHKDRLNWGLEESANRVIFLEDLKQYISK
jgi:uncharacterized LabA/DUF88 family protein